MNKAISSWGNEVNDSDRYIIRDTDIDNEIVATFNDMSDVQHFIDTITSINTGEIGIEVVDTKNNEVIMSKSIIKQSIRKQLDEGDKYISPLGETFTVKPTNDGRLEIMKYTDRTYENLEPTGIYIDINATFPEFIDVVKNNILNRSTRKMKKFKTLTSSEMTSTYGDRLTIGEYTFIATDGGSFGIPGYDLEGDRKNSIFPPGTMMAHRWFFQSIDGRGEFKSNSKDMDDEFKQRVIQTLNGISRSTRKMKKQRIIKGTEALLFCTDDPEMYLMTHDGYPEHMLNTPFGTISEQMVEPDYDYYRPGNVSYYYKYSWDGNIQEIDIAEARTMYDRIMEYRREREQDEWSTRKMRKSLNWVDATNVRGQPYSTSDTEGYDYLYGIDFQDGQYRTAITDNANHVEYEVKYFPTMDEAKAYLEGIYNSGRYKMTDGITAEGCRKASPILAKSFKEQFQQIKSKKRW